mmetsp:Transcript_27802/g.60773  ORF Transcript_27802/g.60773 Transcript_27802/m.60773 type:complete len:372 (-) Transcript_27802:79-1194(-)
MAPSSLPRHLLLLSWLKASVALYVKNETVGVKKAFHSGEVWLDVDGEPIDAHGAGIMEQGGTYYWYGEARHGQESTPESCFVSEGNKGPTPLEDKASLFQRSKSESSAGFTKGVNLYVSQGDLYTWKFKGLVFEANSTGTHCVERPKVIQCPGTGQYVLWAKGFPLDGSVRAVVATSSSPLGPFKLARPEEPFYSPDGHLTYADATLYVDPHTKKAYSFFRTRDSGFRVAELSEDCTSLKASVEIADDSHEAPAVFEHKGRLFVWTSGTKAWSATAAKLLVSFSGFYKGPFVDLGNPTNDETTFNSQGTFILRNPAFRDGIGMAPYIFMADRWEPWTVGFGKYVWLPLFVDLSSGVRLGNVSSWSYEEKVP